MFHNPPAVRVDGFLAGVTYSEASLGRAQAAARRWSRVTAFRVCVHAQSRATFWGLSSIERVEGAIEAFK